MLHGFLASSVYWQPLIKQLTNRYHVIAFDLLGFGDSTKPRRSKYDYDAHLTALHNSLMARQPSGEPFILVGHSMGSLLALRYSLRYPGDIKRLVLLNPPLLTSRAEVRHEILGTNLLYRLGLTPGVHRMIWPAYRFAAHAHLLSKRLGGQTYSFKAFLFKHNARSRLRSFRGVIMNNTALQDLLVIRVPTLLVQAAGDRTIYRTNLMAIELPSNVRRLELPGDHHLPFKQAEQVACIITEF